MGTKNRFRWERALPAGNRFGSPPFGPYHFVPLRQVSTLLGTATAGGGITAVMSAIIPPNSWARGKMLMIRGHYLFTIPAVGFPPAYNVTEFIHSTQGVNTALLTPGGFAPAASQFETFITRYLIRQDPTIRVFDGGDVSKFNWANTNNFIRHVQTHAATVPPFDYSLQMQIDLSFNLPPTIAGATIQGVFCEGFLEQATNLGAAT